MGNIRRASALAFTALVLASFTSALAGNATPTSVEIIPSGAAAKAHLDGRMLLFIQAAHGKHPPRTIEPGFVATDVDIIGFDVHQRAGTGVSIPAAAAAFPTRLSALRPGTYDVQPLLDVRRMYSYDGRNDGDLYGPVQRLRIIPGAQVRVRMPLLYAPVSPKSTADVKVFSIVSRSLSAFYGKTTRLRATVILPIGYNPHKKYPVVYFMNGFGGNYASGFRFVKLRSMMNRDGLHALVVVTDSTAPTGITQFTDSANNGPWGHAFIHEFIPAIERAFPADARPSRRFLWGHSSGGWASLWLQITYPFVFGGSWSSSPDPVDFHDFTGPNLLKHPLDNAYVDPYGRPWQLVRLGTHNVMSLRDFVLISDVEGFKASQFGSFDAVFSPRGKDGNPMPLFNHRTGKVDPAVAAYWEAHYDIAAKIARNFLGLQSTLEHKVHIAVGTLDTFHLERGVLRLDARIRQMGVTPNITHFPNASHSSLFQKSTGFEGFHWAFRGMARAASR